MPSVATNGVIFILVMTSPLTSPQAAPTSTPTSIAGTTGIPDFTSIPVTVPERARTEPTLRSMPPVMITSVIPMPSNPITEVCSRTVKPLFTERNAELPKANTMIRMSNVKNADSLWNISAEMLRRFPVLRILASERLILISRCDRAQRCDFVFNYLNHFNSAIRRCQLFFIIDDK